MSTKLYQFRAPEKFQVMISELTELTGVSTGADVIRDALSYYAWMIEEIQQGREIIAKSKDSTEIIKPCQPKIISKNEAK